MKYTQRLSLAITLSLLMHVALAAAWRPTRPDVFIPVEEERVAVRLREEPLQLIDVYTPADAPPEDAELIAIQDSQAMDTSVSEEETVSPGPVAEAADEMDSAPRPATVPPEPPVEQAPPVAPPEPAQAVEAETDAETLIAPEAPATERIEVARATAAPERSAPPQQMLPVPSPQPPAVPEAHEPPQDLRARPRGRTVTHGMTNFEALQHDIAPYLKQIRDKVEQRWIEALLMRYTGTSPARAEVFCAIAPDGTLVEARIVGMTDDVIFAGICRDAVARAAPFGPFPFETPDIYRNKNLEINWHFSFL